MNAILCFVPLFALGWDGGNAPLNPKSADELRPVLASRELKSMLLSAQEQKRYEAALSSSRLPQQTGHVAPDKAQLARQLFKQAEIQLRYKQEDKALETETQGLDALLDKWDAKSKWPASDLGVLQTHFEPLARLLQQDPQLALTFLHELDGKYVQAAKRIKERKAPTQAFAPLGVMWLRLSKADKLGDGDWDTAAFWAPLSSPSDFPDRKLTGQERTQYQIDLAAVSANYNTRAGFAARLQAAQASSAQIRAIQDRQRAALAAANQPPSARARLLQSAGIDYANIRFEESLVHLNYGQEQQALLAFNDGTAHLAQSWNAFPGEGAIAVKIGNLTVDQFSRQEPLISTALRAQLQAATPKDPCWKQPQQYQPPVRTSIGDAVAANP